MYLYKSVRVKNTYFPQPVSVSPYASMLLEDDE